MKPAAATTSRYQHEIKFYELTLPGCNSSQVPADLGNNLSRSEVALQVAVMEIFSKLNPFIWDSCLIILTDPCSVYVCLTALILVMYNEYKDLLFHSYSAIDTIWLIFRHLPEYEDEEYQTGSLFIIAVRCRERGSWTDI